MIFYDHNAHLLYLVRFRFVSLWLEINYLLDAVLSENVVVSPDAFRHAWVLLELGKSRLLAGAWMR